MNTEKHDKLLIIGAGGHGKVAADIAIKMNCWQTIIFVDDDETTKSCMGFKVIGRSDAAFSYINKAEIFVAIGNNAIRKKIQEMLESEGASIATLIHPNTIIGSDVVIGTGSIVMAGTVINSSTRIGMGCIINTASSLDHDNKLDDYVHISPGANLAGTVTVGSRSWIGIGCVISNNINICSDCIIGAGGVVIKDIAKPGTYVGIPVRKIN